MPALLILGGTAWVGRETACEALARGWEVTCLARGESGTVAAGARHVVADRDSPDAYAEVAGRDWDAVVEVSWQPRHVREAAQALAGRYDAAKVRCELDTLAVHPAPLLVRAGVIVGPGDNTERFPYWPRRAAQAGAAPMLAPAEPAHPLQLIDVRDLVAWMVGAVEAGVTGAVNAVGPQIPFGTMVAAAREAARATGPLVEAPADWLEERGVRRWKGEASLPLWVPDRGEEARTGYHSDERLLATGATLRPLAETMRDVLAEEIALGVERAGVAGLTRERELALLAELG